MSQWTYTQNGQQYGPVTSTQLKQLAAEGQLGVNDLVWREGMTEWAQAGSVKGLFAARAEPVTVVTDNSQPNDPAQADSAIAYFSNFRIESACQAYAARLSAANGKTG